jgi:hypothetical protein
LYSAAEADETVNEAHAMVSTASARRVLFFIGNVFG